LGFGGIIQGFGGISSELGGIHTQFGGITQIVSGISAQIGGIDRSSARSYTSREKVTYFIKKVIKRGLAESSRNSAE
jgi:hypothetical protein